MAGEIDPVAVAFFENLEQIVTCGSIERLETTTADLLRLSEWLAANECMHVAMEATGVYWKPVWHILDDGEFPLVLANAANQ